MRPIAIAIAFVLGTLALGCSVDESVAPLTPSGSGGSGGGAGAGAGGATGTGGSVGPGGIQIPGLTASVEAVYDDSGVLHLHGAADADCFAALGYFHAQNRFFFMDFVRNYVRGSLGSLVAAGDTVLEQDYASRQFFATSEGVPLEDVLYQKASPEVQGLLEAYSRGVNSWIGDMRAVRNGATLTDEYEFMYVRPENIRDWAPEDSAAVGLYVLNDLSNNGDEEMTLGAELPVFPPALVPDVFAGRPVFDAFTVPAANLPPPPAPPPIAPEAIARLAPHKDLLAQAVQRLRAVSRSSAPKRAGDIGSNNWVVGPGRSASGNALLANDPHLSLTNPSIWFPAEIDAKSSGTGQYHVAGGTFPGLPSVMIGHNESIGWGVTTAYWDLTDIYVEQMDDANVTVTFNGEPVSFIERTFDFADASTDTTISKTFRWVPHHGPVLSEDDTAHTAVTIRWRGHEGGTDLDAFFGMALATSVDDAKAALAATTSASQNFVVIDTAGDIGWFPFSQVPDRPWASASLPPWLPLPGDGTAEWGDPVPYDMLPQLENPPAGVIATSNADMTGASADGDPTNDGQPAIQAWGKADGTREQRILDLLDQGGSAHDLGTLQAMQGDTFSLYGTIAVPPVLAAAAAGGTNLSLEAQAVVDALTAWQFTCPTGLDGSDPVNSPKSTDPMVASESIGCTAFHVTFLAIVEAALGDEAAAAGITDAGFGLEFVARALKDPSSVASGDLFWDDVSTTPPETQDDQLVVALERAGAVLAAVGPADDWRWGRVHTFTLRSIFDSFGIPLYNEGPYASGGGLFTVDVANPKDLSLPATPGVPDLGFTNGPSIRLLMEAAPTGPTMKFELPGGADLHRDSDFYNNLLPGWLANEPVDFPFGPEAVPNPKVVVVVSSSD